MDFEYEGVTFSILGMDEILLSTLLNELHIDVSVQDVKDVVFSNPELVEVEERRGDWNLISKKAFATDETLTLTMKDGKTLVIDVKDAQYETNLNNLLTNLSVTINGHKLNDNDSVTVKDGDEFDLHLEISENDSFQFPDDDTAMVFKLPDGINLGDIETVYNIIDMGIDGKVYRNPLVYDKDSNSLIYKWNVNDPNFDKLTWMDNAQIVIDIKGQFDKTTTYVEFNTDLKVNVAHEEPHEANIAKTGTFVPYDSNNPGNTPRIDYVVTVDSNGSTSNIQVTDIAGTALSMLGSVNVTSNMENNTIGSVNNTGNGFNLTIGAMQNGEKITITYSEKVDTSKLADITNATFEETGNKVTMKEDHTPDKEATHYQREIGHNNMVKYSAGVSEVDDNKKQDVTWRIMANENPVESIGNSTITDSIAQSSISVMSYDTNQPLYLTVRDSSGNVVDARSGEVPWEAVGITDPTTQKSWTYHIPETDGVYSYEFTYHTTVDTTNMSGTENTVSNNVEGKPGKGTGTANVGPKPENQKFVYNKNIVSANEEKVVWTINVTADNGTYNQFEVTDILPFYQYNEYGYIDDYVPEETVIVGLQGDEWVDTTYVYEHANDSTGSSFVNTGDYVKPTKVVFVFYKDGKGTSNKNNPGLDASSGQRTFTIQLTTKNSKGYMQLAKDYNDEALLKHINKASVNGYSEVSKTAEPMDKTVFKYDGNSSADRHIVETKNTTDAGRSGGIAYPRFDFRVNVGGVQEDTVVIEDYFDTDLFKIYVPNPVDHNWEPQFWGGNGNKKYAHDKELADYYNNLTWTEGNGKVTFTATNIPKDDKAYYSFYMIQYSLIPKSLEAWNTIKQMAMENGGEYIFRNIAKYDESESELDFKYKYSPLDKTSTVLADGRENYTITINPDKLPLNGGYMADGSTKMKLTDTYSSNLSVDFSTIQITAVGKNGEDRTAEVTYDYSKGVGTFYIPDETAVTLNYSGRVVGDPGSFQVVENTVYMMGYHDTVTSNRTVSMTASGQASLYRIRLFKYEKDHMEEGLNDATFRLLDADKNPVLDKNGREITYTTQTVVIDSNGVIHALDEVINQVYDEWSQTYINPYNESQLKPETTDKEHAKYSDLNDQGLRDLGLTVCAGYVEVTLNQKTQGIALKKERVYYLEEIHAPDGFQKDFIKYSFLITDQSNYKAPGGVYVYHNNDIMTVRNERSEEASLKISKTFTGNADLTDEQKNQVTFTIYKLDDGGNRITPALRQVTYADFTDGVYTLDDVDAGRYEVVETNQDINPSDYVRRTEYLVDGSRVDEGNTKVEFTSSDLTNHVSHDVSITNSYFTNKYEIKKVSSDTAQVLGNATFAVYKASDNSPVVTDLKTGSNGKLAIQFNSSYHYDTLYYIMETDAPSGYVLPEHPEKNYFYFSTPDVTPAWKPASSDGLPEGESAADITVGFGSVIIPNQRDTGHTHIDINKKWVDGMGKDVTGTMTDRESVTVTLKRTTDKIASGKVITGNRENNASDVKTVTFNWTNNGESYSKKLYYIADDRLQITVKSLDGVSTIKPSFSVSGVLSYDATNLVGGYDYEESTVKSWLWKTNSGGSDNATVTISRDNEATVPIAVTIENIDAGKRVYKLTQAEAEAVSASAGFSITETLSPSNDWSWSVDNLDLEDASGNLYTYFVVENNGSDTGAVYDVGSSAITVTNTAPDKLEVIKRWYDVNGNRINDKTDGSIDFDLYQVVNESAVGGYTGTGNISLDYRGLNNDGIWNHGHPSGLSGNAAQGLIKEGSTVRIQMVATSKSNQLLQGTVTFTGIGAVLSDDNDENVEYEVYDEWGNTREKSWNRTRTIVVSDVTEGFAISGIMETNNAYSLIVDVLEEPTEAVQDFESKTKNKLGTVHVTYDTAVLTLDSAYSTTYSKVYAVPGTKAYSALIANLPTRGTILDNGTEKSVTYTYYVQETTVTGFPNAMPAEYENNEGSAAPGGTIVIRNQEDQPQNTDLTVTKTLDTVNTSGGDLSFYVGLFASANATTPIAAENVGGANLQEVKVANGQTSGTVTFTGLTVGETYYVFETKQDGTKVTTSDRFNGYAIKANDVTGKEVTMQASGNTAEITNNYSATGSVDFKAKKVFTNGVLSATRQFSFKLTQVAAKDSTVQATENIVLSSAVTVDTSATNGSTDVVSFDPIQFTKNATTNQTGEYWFLLEEVLPAGVTGENPVKDNIKYDVSKKWIKVTVSDDGKGNLTVTKAPETTKDTDNQTDLDGTWTNEQFTHLDVNKKWWGADGSALSSDKLSGKTITLTLYRVKSPAPDNSSAADTITFTLNGSADNEATALTAFGSTAKAKENDDWTASFYGLPLSDSNGQTTYSYYVAEAKVDGFDEPDYTESDSATYPTTVYQASEITVTDGNGKTVYIHNKETQTYSLPSTGGVGTGIYYGAGLGLMLLAVLGFVLGARKRSRGEGI